MDFMKMTSSWRSEKFNGTAVPPDQYSMGRFGRSFVPLCALVGTETCEISRSRLGGVELPLDPLGVTGAVLSPA
jgi:hypothetical protein